VVLFFFRQLSHLWQEKKEKCRKLIPKDTSEGGSWLTIDLTRAGCALVVKICGELDLSTSPVFRDKVEEELAHFESFRHLILDLEETSFIDSSGLGVILGRFKSISQRGGRMIAVNVPPHLEKLFALSGLLKIMTICPTAQDALNTL